MSQSWPIKLVLQVILPHNRDSADVSAKCLCVHVQGFIQRGGSSRGGFRLPHSESLGGISHCFFANTKVKSKLNNDSCHQVSINSWLCDSFR